MPSKMVLLLGRFRFIDNERPITHKARYRLPMDRPTKTRKYKQAQPRPFNYGYFLFLFRHFVTTGAQPLFLAPVPSGVHGMLFGECFSLVVAGLVPVRLALGTMSTLLLLLLLLLLLRWRLDWHRASYF